MKKYLWALTVLLVFVCVPAAYAAERILSFDSHIRVNVNGMMQVTETIRVFAEGVSIKHGIYRDFPTRYKDSSGKNIEVVYRMARVTRDGAIEEFRVQRQGNGIRVYIGRKAVDVSPGEHTYELMYVTERQLGFFKDHDELYWNVTGNGWAFDIERASASVDLPSLARDSIKEVDGYTGIQGAKGKEFESHRDDEGRVIFQTTRSLGKQEGLTLLVAWKKGAVLEPSGAQRAGYFIKDNLGVVLGGAGLVILFLFFLFTWDQVGRDPVKGVIIPLFYPPDGFSPSALRYLTKMGFDNKAMACAVINMAVKGYLTIDEAIDGVTRLTKIGQSVEKLSPEEAVLARELFQNGASLELKTSNHETVARGILRMKNALAKSMDQHYFVTNQGYFAVGLLISLLVLAVVILFGANQPSAAIFMMCWLSIWTLGVIGLAAMVVQQWGGVIKGSGSPLGALFMTFFALPFFVGEVFGIVFFCQATSAGVVAVSLSAIILDAVFYHLLKAPTLQGRRVLDQVDGFKMYLGVAEKDHLKTLGRPQETTELFEQYLPFALALDMEQAWAERFSDVLARASVEGRQYHPSWYRGALWSTAGCAGFATGLGVSLSNSISSSSVAPGSSSGGGGGGSSGGGGGGGGGGGW